MAVLRPLGGRKHCFLLARCMPPQLELEKYLGQHEQRSISQAVEPTWLNLR